jgi:hypothetical protein
LPGQRLAPRCRQRSPASLPDNHMTADTADVMTGSIRPGGDVTRARGLPRQYLRPPKSLPSI